MRLRPVGRRANRIRVKVASMLLRSGIAPFAALILAATGCATQQHASAGSVQASSLASQSTAAPVTLAAATAVPAVTAAVPPSSGPAAPDPTTLAGAEQRARLATTDPGHATIEAASAATAAQLRIAGLTFPASVKATTVMFVVVVDRATVLSSETGHDSAQSPRFAVVFNSDGSGRGDQAVYHGAFGLPDSPTGTSPAATVVDAAQLSTGPLPWTPAPAGSLAHAVPLAVALRAIPPAQFPSLAKPLAALVYVTTLHVTHRLAWVIETYGSLIEGGGGPIAEQPCGRRPQEQPNRDRRHHGPLSRSHLLLTTDGGGQPKAQPLHVPVGRAPGPGRRLTCRTHASVRDGPPDRDQLTRSPPAAAVVPVEVRPAERERCRWQRALLRHLADRDRGRRTRGAPTPR